MLEKIAESCIKYADRTAFNIKNNIFTYSEFGKRISGIRNLLQEKVKPKNIVGIITYDEIETYASVIAAWFANIVFLPLNPNGPKARNMEIIQIAGLKYILSCRKDISNVVDTGSVSVIYTCQLPEISINLTLPEMSNDDVMYIMYTSGSTGVPKAVPISRINLKSFIDSFLNAGYLLNEKDRFLQIYDLSFDASIHCYILPLCIGASIYTVPQNEIRYLYAYELLNKYDITFAKMTPTALLYLRPFFHDIKLKTLRYFLLGGEELQNDLVGEWSECVPNAEIHNVYGPTEATINCMIFKWTRAITEKKTFNGIVSIGKPFGDTVAIVIDKNYNMLPKGKRGELCVSGKQVTTGYLNNPKDNNKAFFVKKIKNKNKIFYKTGDEVVFDNDGDFLFCGRIDDQVQIQGYRIEPGEIEKNVKNFVKRNCLVITKKNETGNILIYLFVEDYTGNTDTILEYIKSKLPHYMLPHGIINIPEFPQNLSGKIDRKKLLKMI